MEVRNGNALASSKTLRLHAFSTWDSEASLHRLTYSELSRLTQKSKAKSDYSISYRRLQSPQLGIIQPEIEKERQLELILEQKGNLFEWFQEFANKKLPCPMGFCLLVFACVGVYSLIIAELWLLP